MSKFANKRYIKESTIVKCISIDCAIVESIEKIHPNFEQFTREALEFYLEKCEFDAKNSI